MYTDVTSWPSNLNRREPLPLYYQLKELLKDLIDQGKIPPHQQLPSEQKLAERYGISRMTARRTLEELVAEGYVYRAQGRGTFVAEPKLRQSLMLLTSFSEDMRARGLEPGAKVIDVDVLQRPGIARKLQADDDEHLIKVQRVRLANREPMALETSFLRHRFCPGLEEADLTNRSLYEVLASQHGVQLARAEQTLEAKLSDEYESDILQIAPGSAVLLIERLTFLDDDVTPVEFVSSTYRADRYKFFIQLDRR